MNEHKKTRYEYFNPTVSEQKATAEDLLAQLNSFIRGHQLKAGDWIILNKLIKQLNGAKSNLPRKVLRSIVNKFNDIKRQY